MIRLEMREKLYWITHHQLFNLIIDHRMYTDIFSLFSFPLSLSLFLSFSRQIFAHIAHGMHFHFLFRQWLSRYQSNILTITSDCVQCCIITCGGYGKERKM